MKNKTASILTIVDRSIRKERGRNQFRVTIKYITKYGINRMVSFLCDNRTEAKNKMNFRLCGITQGNDVVGI